VSIVFYSILREPGATPEEANAIAVTLGGAHGHDGGFPTLRARRRKRGKSATAEPAPNH
jgi:hypothetical protein